MTPKEIRYQARQFDAWWLKTPGYLFIRDGFDAWATGKQFSPHERKLIWEATQPKLLEPPDEH